MTAATLIAPLKIIRIFTGAVFLEKYVSSN